MNDQVTPEPQCDPDSLASTGVLAELESAMSESDAPPSAHPGRAEGAGPEDPSPIESLRLQVLELQRENKELSGQAQAMFEAMDKKGRANWLKRDERIRELTAERDQQERTIRELREQSSGGSSVDEIARPSEEIAELRGRLEQAERDRDEALALRDKAEQNAVELFDSLSGEARASWMDRDELKNQLDELRSSYEEKIAALRQQAPAPASDEETGQLRAAVEELAERGRSLADELGRRDEECASLRRECERLTAAAAERAAETPASPAEAKDAPPDELEYLRTVASELVERHEENRTRIEVLQRENGELARAVAEAKESAGSPVDSEIEGLLAAIQQRESLLDDLQNRLEDAERRASEAGSNDPELVSILYERLAQAEARERELIGQLEGSAPESREQFQHIEGARKELAERLSSLEAILLGEADEPSAFVPSLDLDDDLATAGASLDDLGSHYQRLGRLVDACERQSRSIVGGQADSGAATEGGGASLKAEIERLTAQLQERDQLLDELQGHFEQIIASTENGEFAAAAGGQGDHLQAKVDAMIEREQELRLEIAQQAEENRKLRLEVDRMCQQVAEGALRNQELVHLRQVIGEFAGREQYIEELELRLEGYESGGIASGGAPGAGDDSVREENRLLRAQIEQLSREMESIAELHDAVKDLESARMQSIRLQDQLQAREAEVNNLSAELEKSQAERDREIQSLRIELAKAEASRARDRLDSSGVVDLWSTRGTSAGGTTNGTQFSAPQRTATTTVTEDEGPTSIDERIRAFRQHLDSLEHTRNGAPGNGKRKGGGGFFSRIFGRKR